MPTPLEKPPEPEAVQRPHVCFLAPTTWPTFAGARDIPVVGGAELQQTIVAEQKRWVNAHASIETATRELQSVYARYLQAA